jgi:hypothetical protein
MSALNDEREVIAGKLMAAGITVTALDPTVVPPAVLIAAPTVTSSPMGIGGWTAAYPINVLHPPPGNAAALAWLLEQVEIILATLPGASATPVIIDHVGGDVPSYTVTVTRQIANPYC